MAVPAHLLVTYRGIYGTVAAPLEEWSFSLKFENKVDDTIERLQGFADGALSAGWTVHLDEVFPTDVRLTECRAAYILGSGLTQVNSDGTYLQGVKANLDLPGVAVGANPLPLQTALCVSLQTARSGPTGKGRFYVPTPGVNLDSSHVMPQGATEAYATAFGQFINGLETAMDRRCIVASSKGYTSPVTSVRVGRVLDTMRSRREGQAEGYVTYGL